MISKLCFCSLCFYFYPDTVHAKVWFEGEMKENGSLLKILSAAPPRHHAPLVGLIAQIRKKRKSWKLLKLLLFHACLARLPSDWQKYGE